MADGSVAERAYLREGRDEAIPAAGSGIAMGGHAFVADPTGALYWPAEDTLIVADLHLEKGSSLARRGALLPPYDTGDTLRRLASVVARLRPARVVALGDSFHDDGGAGRMTAADRAVLRGLQAGRAWLWVAGNHDPDLPDAVGGERLLRADIGGVALVHAPGASGRDLEIAGHLHPAARLRHRGATVRRKCFAGDGGRLVLPAFGAYAGGLNVLDKAFDGLFARQPIAWLLGKGRVYPIARRQLLAD